MSMLVLAARYGLMALVLTSVTSSMSPRATVSGQVTILERPGEPTEDLANAVVFLEPVTPAPLALRPGKVVMALEKRQFAPRVRVITEGSTVEFPNEDRFSHNVFSKTNGGFDTQEYGRGKKRAQTFREPGVYPLYCNVHPRMTGFVIALRTPYFTQPGADGRFTIDNVPPGDYRLVAWHDRARQDTVAVRIAASGGAPLRIELDARTYRFVQHKNKFGREYQSASGDRY